MSSSLIDQIKSLRAGGREALNEKERSETLHFYLIELHRIIKGLMDETADTDDQDMKVALASLEYAARKQRRAIEERLAVRT